MTQLADTPGIPRATDGVPLTREERAYLHAPPSHPVDALAAWEHRDARRRELVRRYRDRGVLPDDWDLRIAWIQMDPRTYYVLERAQPTADTVVSPECVPLRPDAPEAPRRTWRQHLTRALHTLRP